jgi:hypothetical protein
VVGDEQPRNVLVFNDGNADGLGFIGERVQHRPAGVVAGVTGAPVGMRAEEALVEAAVFSPREWAAPVG